LAAPNIAQKKDSVAKNVIFVLDKSGSMKKDNKIKQAKDALEFCIRSLNKKDHFAVVSFSDEIITLSKLSKAKQDNIDDICGKLQKVDASGGTNIDDALQTAFELLPDGDKPSYIIFLTDGLPTVGVRDAKQILKNAKDSNKTKCRVFTFGVGFDVNTLLLDQLSQTNKGLSTYVKPNQDIEVSVSSLYSKISDPVLADLKLDFDDVSTSKIYPRELPDLFSGSQLVVLGRYEKGGDSLIELSGKADGEKKRFKDEFSFTRKNTRYDFIPRLWAARRIGYLMNEIRINGKNKELVQEIIDLSKRFGILTEFTSFLVTDAPIAMHPVAPAVREKSRLRSLGYAGMKMDRGLKESSGRDAVANSEIMQQQLQNADSLSVQNSFFKYGADNKKQVQRIQGVRYAGQQAFFNQQNAWVSTKYDANQKTIQVKPFSAAYFQLADLSPDVSAILALGENVSFVRNNIMVQIDEKGLDELSKIQIKELR
jgi:Ca-activated chloride channel homolog